jgi:hypothetical protein
MLKQPSTTMGFFFSQTAYCLRPCECNGNIICIGGKCLLSYDSFSIAFGFEILWKTTFGKSIESNKHEIVVVTGPTTLYRHRL